MNINVCFVKLGVPINMQVTDDMMFSEVAFKYLAKAGYIIKNMLRNSDRLCGC